ncbi:MAG: hypothetical protein KGJ41_13540 [Rhodospirillales bacterium]|nr:hypothetical protein [Rhodospirillales bacterium]MDE2574716.1 hypothetical protein [Rhodospirillales bacterium]
MLIALWRGRRASVSIFSALMLPALAGMAGLAAEYGDGLLTKIRNQRVADISAYSAALTYSSTASSGSMNGAAQAAAGLNGVPGSAVTSALVSSPTGDGNSAVQVTVTSNVPKMLSSLLSSGGAMTVAATSFVELKANAAACITALSSSGVGVSLSGGTNLTASKCAIASQSTVASPCGTYLTSPAITYNTTAPTQTCGFTPPAGQSSITISKKAASDPLAGNTEVATLTAYLGTVSSMTAPAAPTVTAGGNINFGYSASSTISQVAADGCVAAFSSPTWTVTCSGNGPFHFGNITTGGGITVNFNTGGSSSATYDFSGSINNTGTAMHFGPGTYNIAQGIITGGGTTTTFGAGTFNIGALTTKCNSAYYSICHTGSILTFDGPSDFNLSNGFYNAGGEKLTMGSGTTNSYQLGRASNGDAITVGGGSVTTMADATGAGDLFTADGNLNFSGGGGSCMAIPAAANHDINGNIMAAGGVVFGAGIYTVNGYIGIGTSNGGDVSCFGTTLGISATDVTFVTSGANASSNLGDAFYVGAGYAHVSMTAPTSGANANLLVIGPTSSSNTAGAVFTGGATHTDLSGAFYTPNGAVSLSGGSKVGSGTGQCLEVIGAQVSLSGGSALASTCAGLGGTSSTGFSVALVQ